jgi:hypothetical protein
MGFWFATVCCASALVIACGGKRDDQAGTPTPAPATPKTAATATPPKSNAVFKGTIEGVVRLASDASLPRLQNMKDGSKFSMTEPVAPCSPLADEDLVPVAMSANRELRDIHVALTGMTDYPNPEPQNHDLYLSDCRLTPRLVGAAIGDSLRITNRSPIALLPVFSGESFMQAVMPEASRVLKVEKLGANRVACTFGSFCGRTDVLVTAHPFFAVSDAKGHFVIEKVPFDQEVVVHAWHPLFLDSTAKVRLTAADPKRVIELVLTPNEEFVPKPVDSNAKEKPRGKTAKASKPTKPLVE